MRPLILLAASAFLVSAPALAAPVEVTRFHTPETLARLEPGWIIVAPAPGVDPAGLETRVWLDAVARALRNHGFYATGSGVDRIVEVRLTQDTLAGAGRRSGSSVNVGVGTGWGGGWRSGSHVGLGVGFGLGGSGRREQVVSELSVVIRDAETRAALWEGRALTRQRAGSRDADPARVAERLADALFAGFPGRSGETIEVR